MKEIVKMNDETVIQKLVLDGDLSKMTPAEKVSYYHSFCQSLGLNPLTQPFQLIIFQGKQRLYATKDCTEQLRKIHGVSITDVTALHVGGCYVVTAKALDKNGKMDAATGAVPIEGVKGADLANALMKAETKAKRRVTLSICGLGMLDESETDTMKGAKVGPITEDIQYEEQERPLLPGHWYAKLDRCYTKEDVDALALQHKETIQANHELKELFIETKKTKKHAADQPLTFTVPIGRDEKI